MMSFGKAIVAFAIQTNFVLCSVEVLTQNDSISGIAHEDFANVQRDTNTIMDHDEIHVAAIINAYATKSGCVMTMSSLSTLIDDVTLYGQDEIVYHLKCDIEKGMFWNFDDFRDMTSTLPQNTTSVAMDITCNFNGEINLPWPMAASHLRYITVDKCWIYNYLRDIYDDSITSKSDSITYFRISDPAFHTSVDDLMRNLRLGATNETKESACGPQYTYAWIRQNTTYVFPKQKIKTNKTINMEVVKAAKSYFQKLTKAKKIQCNYPNLRVYDRSRSKYIGAREIETMVSRGVYPQLQVFNLSSTLLLNIPQYLRRWRLYFPKLKCLDLQYNSITDFKEVIDHGMASEDPTVGTIDLRHNNITIIPYETLRSMRHHKFVKVDIRDNPFDCRCEMRAFVDYMRNPHNNYTKNAEVTGYKYTYLKDLKCANPPRVRGRRIVTLSYEDLGCEVEVTIIPTSTYIALGVIAILLLMAIILAVRYRQELAYIVRTRRFHWITNDDVDSNDHDAVEAKYKTNESPKSKEPKN